VDVITRAGADVDERSPTGRVERVNGPVVHLSGLGPTTMFEYVEVGHDHLPGEIITIDRDRAVAQLYEYTGGLTVGQPAWATGHALTVSLGPGLLGGIFDGLLRPLAGAGDFLGRRGLDRPAATSHRVEPVVEVGVTVAGGDVIATVTGTGGPDQLVIVPPDVAGVVEHVEPAGTFSSSDPIATVGATTLSLTSDWPIRTPRPHRGRRHDPQPFLTGQRILDVLEPIAKGSSATVIGGFGEGKTVLLEQLAKWGDADVIIYLGCGERGNELADLIDELSHLVDPRSSRPLLERTVILANTSNMPVMAREASIYTAVTVAEYFRDMGLHAVIIADSTSRWAEARRELASRTGAIPAEQGYPADLPSSLAAFYQRAGRVVTTGGRDGTVTIVTSVSPPGGDATEPVSAHTQRFVQAVWALDRDLAYARHYPAIAWQRSFSRDVDAVARWHTANGDPGWSTRRARLQALLSESARLQSTAELVGLTSMPTDERLTILTAGLVSDVVLQQSALSENDAFCDLPKQQALAQSVLDVHDATLELGRGGVPASVIEGFDFGPLIRAKNELGPGDADEVERRTADLIAQLRALAT
jgi:V/A-type H+-transporting ATPase subunit A